MGCELIYLIEFVVDNLLWLGADGISGGANLPYRLCG